MLDFTVDSIGDYYNEQRGRNVTVVNFTMVFEEPYMLGLLLKKSDKLYVELNP